MAKPEYYALNKSGSTGPDVSLIQIWLNAAHNQYPCVDTLNVDGKFGPKTQQAVLNFQCVTGLQKDGLVGQNTWNALYVHYASTVGPGEQYPGTAMRSGNKGATVKSAQHQLTHEGYPLTQDGVMGSKTTAAVRKFQQGKGLSVDGVIGPDTWAALYN